MQIRSILLPELLWMLRRIALPDTGAIQAPTRDVCAARWEPPSLETGRSRYSARAAMERCRPSAFPVAWAGCKSRIVKTATPEQRQPIPDRFDSPRPWMDREPRA